MDNTFLLGLGYVISALLNTEVLKGQANTVSHEKTDKLYLGATFLFESIGAWHNLAETLRKYADYLDFYKRPQEAEACRSKANKVDPSRHA